MADTATSVRPAAGSAEALRRRVTAAVFGGIALGSTGVFATITVAPIIAVDLTGSAALSGVPTAAVVAGSVLGAAGISALTARRGRRAGLLAGYGLAAAGACSALVAVIATAFPLLVLGVGLVGVANSAVLQSRFVVADIAPEGRRTARLSLVLWAGTIGALVGPNAVGPAARMAAGVGLPVLSGALAFAAAAFATCAAGCVMLPRTDPGAVRDRAGSRSAVAGGDRVEWGSPVLAVALTAMIVGQFVLAAIQTMTPLHVSATGAGLDTVGVIMSSHVLGMYVLTPVAGWLSNRAGHLPVIVAGLLLQAGAGVAAAAAPAGHVGTLAPALFVLGVGWSFGFVPASGLLTRGASFVQRARTQGAADTLVFSAAALASAGSGVLMSAGGFATLCLLGAAVAVAAVAVIARNRAAVRLVLDVRS